MTRDSPGGENSKKFHLINGFFVKGLNCTSHMRRAEVREGRNQQLDTVEGLKRVSMKGRRHEDLAKKQLADELKMRSTPTSAS